MAPTRPIRWAPLTASPLSTTRATSGSGQTVALYELQGYQTADIAAYQSCFGTSTPVTTVDVDGGPTGRLGGGRGRHRHRADGRSGARHQRPRLRGAEHQCRRVDTYDAIVSQDEASVVSTSWGLCEPYMGSAAAQAENTLFEEAATQGQTIVAASGDEGSEDCVDSGDAYDSPGGRRPLQPALRHRGRRHPVDGGTAPRPPKRPGTTDRHVVGGRAAAGSPASGDAQLPVRLVGHRGHQRRFFGHTLWRPVRLLLP